MALEQVHVDHPLTGVRLATLTVGARSVLLRGPLRLFGEATAPHAVSHRDWVRTLPRPFDGAVDAAWLASALGANVLALPDVLDIAMQYLHGAPDVEVDGLRIAGEAHYGPLVGSRRAEGSDFNDYLGVAWVYNEGPTDPPEASQLRCLDCSGFMRMVWGYRTHAPTGGVPLCLNPRGDGAALPRRAHEMFVAGPGVVVVEASSRDFDALQVGDLVFFDADRRPKDESRFDHVGLYLGMDAGGHRRFVSSRKTHDGPTFGDVGGASVLDGNGFYARAWRGTRRL